MLFWLAGATVAIAASFPLAALVALVFRFPIPFGSYMSGPDAVVPALFAAGFYLFLGGFAVQAALGAVAGGLAARTATPENPRPWQRCLAFATIAALPGVLTLAVLDWIIGAW
jgi:hypothetical protein